METYSTEKIIEFLENKNYTIQKRGNIYRATKNNCREIKFRERFEGGHIFFIDKFYYRNFEDAVNFSGGLSNGDVL